MISIGHDIGNAYAKYGFDHFLFKYGIRASVNQAKSPDVSISYSSHIESGGGTIIQIVSNAMQTDITGYLQFGSNEVPLFEIPKKLDVGVGDKVLANFQSGSGSYPCVMAGDNGLIIGFDIFNQIGQILSGYLEPIFLRENDESKRLARSPIVDILEEFLFDSFESVLSSRNTCLQALPFWPDDKKFALVLTHDVDRVYKKYQYAASVLKYIRARNSSGIVGQIRSFFLKRGRNNPYWNFDKIVDLENELGVKSTFFFLNESGKLNPFSLQSWIRFSGIYKVHDSNIVEVIRKLQSSGFEIGVHGSFYSYNDPTLLKKEREELEEITGDNTYGIRQHYLNFDPENTFRMQAAAGFKYDSTLGSNARTSIGFGRGTCFPYHPFSSEAAEESSLLEIPLTIMDTVVYDKEDKLGHCVDAMDIVEKQHGILTLLWHQRAFSEEDFPGMTQTYRRLITTAQSRQAWVTTAGELYEWLIYRQKQAKPDTLSTKIQKCPGKNDLNTDGTIEN